MPDFPIIDTHLHVWDHSRLSYTPFKNRELTRRDYHVEDYQADCGALDVEAMVFLECYADFTPTSGQYIKEIEFVEDEAKRDPRLKAIVPMAPLEWGARVLPMLEEMAEKHPRVRGIRRIVEFDDDPRGLAMSDEFLTGCEQLAKFDWHFEINVNHTQMDIVRDFVPRLPGVRLILDHCGKPGIAEGALDQYRQDLIDLARYPNLWIKLSDLPIEADWENWTEAELRPYIELTLEHFGAGRTIFAGDYPICLPATSLERWVKTLDRAFADIGLLETETRKIYRDNAIRFYRLEL